MNNVLRSIIDLTFRKGLRLRSGVLNWDYDVPFLLCHSCRFQVRSWYVIVLSCRRTAHIQTPKSSIRTIRKQLLKQPKGKELYMIY